MDMEQSADDDDFGPIMEGTTTPGDVRRLRIISGTNIRLVGRCEQSPHQLVETSAGFRVSQYSPNLATQRAVTCMGQRQLSDEFLGL